MMLQFSIRTHSHTEFIDITSEISTQVIKSDIRQGLAVVFIPHTTAAIIINEHADPSVAVDTISALDQQFPWDGGYHHTEGNAAAHIKASLLGSSIDLIIADGKPVLGTWQGIFFCEFDGPRSRNVIIKIMKSD